MICGIGCRYGSNPGLLWLWCRPVITAQIQSLAWEPPYAADVTLKRKKKKKGRNIMLYIWHFVGTQQMSVFPPLL